MSTKRQPSKQRRQSQNQKQRAALEARRQAAASAAPSGKERGSASGGSRGSVLSRLRGAPSTARVPRTTGATRATGGIRSGNVAVGQRAALSAVFAAVAAAVVGSFVFQVPVDRVGEPILGRDALVGEWAISALDAVQDAPDASAAEVAASVDDWMPSGSEPYGQAFWPISASALLPVIGTGLGLRAVTRRSSAKLVNRTMYVTLFGSLLASQLLLIFLPAVIALAVAAFQVRKAEVSAAAAAGPADDGVIDVDEVDDEDELDELDEVADDEELADEDDDLIDADVTEPVDDDEVDDDEVDADEDEDEDEPRL